MNIAPVNNYNDKVSFKQLLPRFSDSLDKLNRKTLEKCLNNPEVFSFVKYYHDLGIDIYIDRYNDRLIEFSRRIVSEILNKLDYEQERASIRVWNNELDKFNAQKAIKELDENYEEQLRNLLSAKNPKSMLAKFNYGLEVK